MNDSTAVRSGAGPSVIAPVVSRRRVLQLALVLPAGAAVLGGCSGTGGRDDRPDPLIALTIAARADAALAAAAVAADPALAPRIDPLREARTEHAAALDAEVVRMGGAVPPSAPATTAPAAPPATLTRVREAVAASHVGAAELVEALPAERVGLVAAVAACCATYAGLLT